MSLKYNPFTRRMDIVGSSSTAAGAYLELNQTTPQTITGGQPVQGVLTASELVATDANKKLQSLAVATYPSLTELSYVKGVTSAIQTQLAGKLGTGLALLLAGGTMTGGITNSTSVDPLTTLAESWIGPSSTTGIYFKGGNVGIGTTNPTSILHTVASGAKTANFVGNYLTNTATSSTASVTKTGLSIESTGTWNGTSAVNRGLYVNVTGGTNNYAAIFNAGSVGIGTTAPAYRLEVINSTTAYAMNIENSFQPSGGLSIGGRIVARWLGGTSLMYGVLCYARQGSASVCADAYGGMFIVDSEGGAGTITRGRGGHFSVSANNGMTISTGKAGEFRMVATGVNSKITDAYGVYVLAPTIVSSGVITNAYGIYLENITGAGTINNAIVTNAGNIIFNEGGDASTDFRVESDTEANMVFLDANGSTDGELYLGGTTNGVKILKGGSLSFIGTAGITDATNISFGTTTGSKIGNSATAKLALYDATPIIRQNHIVDADGTLADATTKINAILTALENIGIVKTA